MKGHQKRVTGLAFSTNLNILVSSGSDAQVSKFFGYFDKMPSNPLALSFPNLNYTFNCNLQLCVWSIDTWEKRKSVAIHIPSGKAPAGDTRVQFHSDQIRLLVVHDTQLAIYDASKMDCIRQVESLL